MWLTAQKRSRRWATKSSWRRARDSSMSSAVRLSRSRRGRSKRARSTKAARLSCSRWASPVSLESGSRSSKRSSPTCVAKSGSSSRKRIQYLSTSCRTSSAASLIASSTLRGADCRLTGRVALCHCPGFALVRLIRIRAPGNDSLGVDADQRLRFGDHLSASAYFDRARPERIDAGQVVDDDCGASTAGNITELLRLLKIATADFDGVVRGVVGPHANWDDVRSAVLAHGGDPRQLTLTTEGAPPAQEFEFVGRKSTHGAPFHRFGILGGFAHVAFLLPPLGPQ